MIALDLFGVPGVITLKVEGRHRNRVEREFSQREDYYGVFYGEQSQTWYFSYHAWDRVIGYLSKLDDQDMSMSRELAEIIKLYQSQQETVARIKNGEAAPEANVQNLKLPLYPYQVIGARWLRLVERALLADEMGLGKSPQSISAALQLQAETGIEKVLVICPATLKEQWKDEIEKFAPDPFGTDAVVIAGTQDRRRPLYGSRFFTIVNYELVKQDIETIKPMCWDLIIIDEAQKIRTRGNFTKNKNGEVRVAGNKTTATIKQLSSKYRFAITGTPIENTIVDMFSILEFIDPMILGSIETFKKRFLSASPWGGQTSTRNSEELKLKLAPITMRREKKYVMGDLPPYTVNFEWSELVGNQEILYDEVESETFEAMEMLKDKTGRDLSQGKFAVLQKLTYLREICDSPELVFPEHKESGKISSLMSLISDNEGKFLVFSQFERMTTILKREIEKRFPNVPVLVISGKVKQSDRNEIKHSFNYSNKKTILLATDAAKEGLNLQAARWVVNYDLPYNPQTVNQRIGRAHRAGGEDVDRLVDGRNVSVVNIVVRNTVEDRVLQILRTKQQIFSDIMTDEKILHTFSMNELRFILSGDKKYLGAN